MGNEFRVDLLGRIDGGVKQTPQGGLDIPAYLTRVGVFTYHQPDGSVQRELRLPDEVFNEDSLATLRAAPLTVGHPGVVRSENWKQHAVGHVRDEVKRKDNFVDAMVRVQDASTVGGVKSKALVELSCGYTCDVEQRSGEYQGEHYDAIQRNIRYNHVALGAKDWGRAGSEVKLRMDGGGIAIVQDMATNEDLQKEIDRLQGENAALKTRADKAEQTAATVKPEDIDVLVADRVALVEDAKLVHGEIKCDGKSAVEVMTEALLAEAGPELKLDGKSEDFVRGMFDATVARVRKGQVEVAKRPPTRLDGGGSGDGSKDLIAEARARNDARSRAAWKAEN